jgi:hypothetical protein
MICNIALQQSFPSLLLLISLQDGSGPLNRRYHLSNQIGKYGADTLFRYDSPVMDIVVPFSSKLFFVERQYVASQSMSDESVGKHTSYLLGIIQEDKGFSAKLRVNLTEFAYGNILTYGKT